MTDHMKRKTLIGATFTAALSFVLFTVIGVVYVTSTVKGSQQQICGVLAVSLQPRPRPPKFPVDPSVQPMTPYGKLVQQYNTEQEKYNKEQAAVSQRGATEVRRLYKNYDCSTPKGKLP